MRSRREIHERRLAFMATFTTDIEIGAPVDDVWEVLAKIDGSPK